MDDTNLDADELLQLALRRIAEEDVEGALVRLKKLVALDPEHAAGTYLLGSVHAELGLMARAAEEIGRACELDPALWTAHFQHGLLLVGLGEAEAALGAWAPLEQLDEAEPLFLFSRAMSRWLQGETEAALADFDTGLAAIDDDDPLASDMHAMRTAALESLTRDGDAHSDATSSSTAPEIPAIGAQASPAARRALLTRYDADATDD